MALFDNPIPAPDLFHFSVDDTAKAYLLDTARWARFLAIAGFVILGLLLAAAIFLGVYLSSYASPYGTSFNSGFLFVFYVLIGVLYFFPTYYLFRFSKLMKPALLAGDQEGFNGALSYLRNAFQFVGIMMLIVLAIYALIFIIMLIGLAMR